MNAEHWIFTLVTAGIGSAAWLEIAWTLAGVCGLAFVIRNMRFTAAQARRLHARPDYDPAGPRAEILAMYRDEETEKLITFGVIILLGVTVMTIPPPVFVPNAIGGIIFSLTFLLFVWYLVRTMQRRLQRRLRVRALLAADPAPPSPGEVPHDPGPA